MKIFGDKKGIENITVAMIILVVVLILSLIYFSGLGEKLFSALGFLKNLRIFGR